MPSPADQYWIDKILTALQNADLNEIGIAEYIQDYQGATRDISTLNLDAQLARMTVTELADHVDEIIHAHLINERVFYLSANDVFSLSRHRQETEAGHLLVFQECERLYQKYDEFIHRNTLKDRQTRLREQGIKLFKEKEERKAQTIDAFRALNATNKRHILRSIRHTSFKRDLQMGFAGIQTVKPTTEPSPPPLDNPRPIHEGVAELDLEQALENWNKENDHVQSLLYPIIYQNYPSKDQMKTKGIKNFTDNLKEQIVDFPEILSVKVLDELTTEFEMDMQTSEHEAFLFHLIHLHNTFGERQEQKSKEVRALENVLKNPYQSFFDFTSRINSAISFKEDNPEFDKIVREVCRNNEITEVERAFLFEKAREYCIDEVKIESYLNTPFIGRGTFKVFVDQICHDLIITDSELSYIQEKAREYNVPEEVLDQMIEDGLIQAQIHNSLLRNSDYYDFVLACLLCKVVCPESNSENLKWIITETTKSDTQRIEIKNNTSLALGTLQPYLPMKIADGISAHSLLEVLGLDILTHQNAIELYLKDTGEVRAGLDDSKLEKQIIIDGTAYMIVISQSPLAPLFWLKNERGENHVFINSDHEQYQSLNLDTLVSFLSVLFHTKISFTDKTGDIFARKFSHHFELLNS